MDFKSVIYLLCFTITWIESARILAMFPTPSISHQVVFRPLTQELVKRGHEVIVITPDPAFPKGQAPKNLTEIDVHDISYSKWKTLMGRIKDVGRDVIEQLDVFIDSNNAIFEEQIKINSVQEILKYKEDYFDLILIEACVRPAIGLSYVFKAPVIQVSSFGAVMDNYYVMGSPTHPFLYPGMVRDRLYNLTIWEKIKQLRKEFITAMYTYNLEKDNEILKRLFGQNVPTVDELSNNVAMLFLNYHPIWDSNRPAPPGVIYMGGLHQNPQKELPKDLKSYLDSSKNGVIYFSLGTNVKPSNLPSDKLQAIINVFSRLPYDVLWKWDNDELPGRSNNIKISKWFPQSDLLRHPNIKLFITQGGLQSTDETITAGVPVIGIPMLGDQWYNAEKYVHFNIGHKLDIDILTEEQLENAIKSILNNNSYRENIVRLRNIMQDQPQSPLERAVWWTEHVLRHRGARHLRSPAANISWTQYLELELVFTLGSVLIISLLIVILVSKAIYNFISHKVTAKIKKA
ncbi:PREDICTED: UDP-glucuronosyltransferase 2B15-like isoform X2 [Papilio xuthus]|uniref:UDP-glucuronosyltransferase n=1 Tax=Papilio xuthus TaxID=66420 RepID=A0AAJ7EA39_PAPXU|nr:PREDICTED: UDP-glucuronosyltransferase 2B15-like isoform X2 [Papilio xuthus]